MIHQVVSEIWVFRMGSTILKHPVFSLLLFNANQFLSRTFYSLFFFKKPFDLVCNVHMTIILTRPIKLIMQKSSNLQQSWKSGRAFWVGFGLKIDQILGLIWAWYVLCVYGSYKNGIKITLRHWMKTSLKYPCNYLNTIVVVVLQFSMIK